MRPRFRIALAVLVLGLFTSVSAEAAADEAKRPPLRPRLGAWLGLSYNSPAGEHWGQTAGRNFHELGFQFAWRLAGSEHVRMEYTLDLIPLAVLTGNPRYGGGYDPFAGWPQTISSYETTYGFGFNPIGLTLGVPLSKAVCVFGSGSFGFLLFGSPVPTPGASDLNYAFAFGGGLEIAAGERWSLQFGYKLHHLSNGGRAYENPGVDSNIYYVGAHVRQ